MLETGCPNAAQYRDYIHEDVWPASNPEWNRRGLTSEEARHLDLYLKTVRNESVSHENSHELCVEAPVSIADITGDASGNGTPDAVIVSPGKISVVDFKYGMRPVSTENNPQLAQYMVGVMHTYQSYGPFESARLTIVQPRVSAGPQIWELDYFDILDEVSHLQCDIDAARDPKAKYVTGDHCKWCPVAYHGVCPALAFAAENTRRFVPSVIDATELGRRLDEVPALEAFIEAAKTLGLARAHAGEPPVGYKLVETHGRRAFTDLAHAENILATCAPEYDAHVTVLRPLTHVETALGKSRFAELDREYGLTHKNKNVVLAKQDDPRPEYAPGPGSVADLLPATESPAASIPKLKVPRKPRKGNPV